MAESHSLATNTTGYATEVAVATQCEGSIQFTERLRWCSHGDSVYSQWCSGGYTVERYRRIPFLLIEWVQHNLLILTCSVYHNLMENYMGWKKSSSFSCYFLNLLQKFPLLLYSRPQILKLRLQFLEIWGPTRASILFLYLSHWK
jgi:hypothetical protein